MSSTQRPALSALCFAVGSALVAGLAAGTAAAQPQPLRYEWPVGRTFSYKFDIAVDADDETTTFKGITTYTVENAGRDQARLVYRGGLTEATVPKRAAAAPGRFGPPGFGGPPAVGPPRIPGPFGRATFAGKTHATNRITISSRGKVQDDHRAARQAQRCRSEVSRIAVRKPVRVTLRPGP